MSDQDQQDSNVNQNQMEQDQEDVISRIDSHIEESELADANVPLPPTPVSSRSKSSSASSSYDDTKSNSGRRREGKIYPPRPSSGKRDLLMGIDFHQISIQVCLSKPAIFDKEQKYVLTCTLDPQLLGGSHKIKIVSSLSRGNDQDGL